MVAPGGAGVPHSPHTCWKVTHSSSPQVYSAQGPPVRLLPPVGTWLSGEGTGGGRGGVAVSSRNPRSCQAAAPRHPPPPLPGSPSPQASSSSPWGQSVAPSQTLDVLRHRPLSQAKCPRHGGMAVEPATGPEHHQVRRCGGTPKSIPPCWVSLGRGTLGETLTTAHHSGRCFRRSGRGSGGHRRRGGHTGRSRCRGHRGSVQAHSHRHSPARRCRRGSRLRRHRASPAACTPRSRRQRRRGHTPALGAAGHRGVPSPAVPVAPPSPPGAIPAQNTAIRANLPRAGTGAMGQGSREPRGESGRPTASPPLTC